MIIGGLDIARYTGIALTNPAADPSKWRTFCLALDKDKTWAKTAAFCHALRGFFQEDDHRPDFVVIEMPLGVVVDYGDGQPASAGGKRTINATTTVSLSSMAGAAIGVLDGLDIPYGMLQPRSWHVCYFGSGFKPRDGDWKAASVERARLHNIPLPVGNRQAQEDCADAVGAACSWTSKAIFIPAHHQQSYMALRTGQRRAA